MAKKITRVTGGRGSQISPSQTETPPIEQSGPKKTGPVPGPPIRRLTVGIYRTQYEYLESVVRAYRMQTGEDFSITDLVRIVLTALDGVPLDKAGLKPGKAPNLKGIHDLEDLQAYIKKAMKC